MKAICRCRSDYCDESDQEPRRRARPRNASDQEGQLVHFGMKAYAGMDADSRVVRTAMGTLTNVGDVTQARALVS